MNIFYIFKLSMFRNTKMKKKMYVLFYLENNIMYMYAYIHP